MLKVELVSSTGKTYLLSGTKATSPVLAPESSLTSLVGQLARTDIAVPGRAGVVPGVARYGAIDTEVEFYLHAETGEEMARVWDEFRAGWSTSKPSIFRVDCGRAGGPYELDAVLSQRLPGAYVDASRRTSMTISVKVFSPGGLFRSAVQSGTGIVTVTNVGDAIIYPEIVTNSSGGVITAPSGATFSIPTGTGIIPTDPRLVRMGDFFPEGVLPGRSGTWRLPPGVTLRWRYLIADPWTV